MSVRLCGHCMEEGHNKRTCKRLDEDPAKLWEEWRKKPHTPVPPDPTREVAHNAEMLAGQLAGLADRLSELAAHYRDERNSIAPMVLRAEAFALDLSLNAQELSKRVACVQPDRGWQDRWLRENARKAIPVPHVKPPKDSPPSQDVLLDETTPAALARLGKRAAA